MKRALRLAFGVLVLSSCALAQQRTNASLSSTASVTLVAVVPENVRVSAAVDSARFEFSPGARVAQANVPISLSWNIKPDRSRNVELYAWLDAPERALVDSQGNAISARQLSAGLDQGSLRSFGSEGQGGLKLFGQMIATGNRQQTINQNLQLQLDLGATPPPAGTYSGIIHLRARVY